MRNITNAGRIAAIAKLKEKAKEYEDIMRRTVAALKEQGFDLEALPEGQKKLLADYFTAFNEKDMVNSMAHNLEGVERESQAQSREVNDFEAKSLIEKQAALEEQRKAQVIQAEKAAADRKYAEDKAAAEQGGVEQEGGLER
jgi:hypothetical protein